VHQRRLRAGNLTVAGLTTQLSHSLDEEEHRQHSGVGVRAVILRLYHAKQVERRPAQVAGPLGRRDDHGTGDECCHPDLRRVDAAVCRHPGVEVGRIDLLDY
jgi:hypothetical protein